MKNGLFETKKVKFQGKLAKKMVFQDKFGLNWQKKQAKNKVFELKKVKFPRELLKKYFLSRNWGKKGKKI